MIVISSLKQKKILALLHWDFKHQFTHILSESMSTNKALTHLPQCRIYASVNQVSIGTDNGSSPFQCQAIIWTNAALLSNGLLEINFSEIWIEILLFSFKKMHLKMSSAKMVAISFSGMNEGKLVCG